MSDNMEPFHIRNEEVKDDDYESEKILDLLPPRFREISGSSTALESFNLMNDDLITHRIIPTLHNRVRILIGSGRAGGLIGNRLRHLVVAAPPPSLILFRLVPKEKYTDVSEMKFIDCALRDNIMLPYPHHEFTALTIPHWPPIESRSGYPHGRSFVETVGHKIIFWNYFERPEIPFCYILNTDHYSDKAFRALDTSTIVEQLPLERLNWITKAIVGDRLIVLLTTTNQVGVFMLSLDVNTERWSVLPQSLEPFNRNLTPIPWKGKLYLVDINRWVFGRTDDTTEVVPMHFDFQRNLWVIGGDENTTFALRFMSVFSRYGSPRFAFQRDPKLVIFDKGRCMISSKSGTLYAISHSVEHPIGNIYAMDDLTGGWRQIECRKSEHTQQVDPFKLLELSQQPPEGVYLSVRVNCWEINEHDILLVVLQSLNFPEGLWARYGWWIFNKDDGVKNYGCEELSRSALEKFCDISLLKLEI